MRFRPPRAHRNRRLAWGVARLTLVGAMLVNCASVYLHNRLRDAGDIITVEFNTSAYGVSARVGPLKAGAYYKAPAGFSGGLRGGRIGRHHSAEFTALFFGADYFSELALADLLPPATPQGQAKAGKGAEGEEQEGAKKAKKAAGPALVTVQRRKAFRARAPLGTLAPAHAKKNLLRSEDVFTVPAYFSQVELSVGLFVGVKIGLNPGELLDFLLGWFTVDLYRDDAPYPDPRLEKLRKNPMFRDLDKKTQQRILQEMDGAQGFP